MAPMAPGHTHPGIVLGQSVCKRIPFSVKKSSPELTPRRVGSTRAPGSAPPPPGSTRRAGDDPGRSGVDAARGVSSGPVGLSRMLVDPALPGPTLPTGVNYGTAGLTPCPGACKAG